jgi:hypothetical protein
MGKKPDKAIHYNQNVEEYAKAGKVEAAAEAARRAVEDEKSAKRLREAEKKGKARARRP